MQSTEYHNEVYGVSAAMCFWYTQFEFRVGYQLFQPSDDDKGEDKSSDKVVCVINSLKTERICFI
jgi:hypothetical protein